jgi:hypothetical protein
MLANANGNNSLTTNIRGYNGATETVTTYKRETVKTTVVGGITTEVSTINDSGTLGNLITYSGGWNRTDMSTQTGQTWLDGQNGVGRGLSNGGSFRTFISVDRINLCRYTTGFTSGINFFANITVPSIYVTANSGEGIFASNSDSSNVYTAIWTNNNGSDGITFGGVGSRITDVKLAANNTAQGVSFGSGRYQEVGSVIGGNNGVGGSNADIRFLSCFNCTVKTATLTNGTVNTGIGIGSNAFNCFVNGGSTAGHAQGVFNFSSGELYLNNFTINETLEVVVSGQGGFVYSNRHDNTDNNSWIFQTGIGEINQQTAVVDSPATTAWRMRPTSSATATAPVLLKLGTVVCAANSLVTVTARMRRDNTGLTMRLVCPGGQISGVTTDVTSDMTAVANTWETVTITFTPTKAGGVDIYAQAFGGTTFSGYVSNLTASQA